jgi:DNA (cytosine-5)-methyltransferase 1
MASYYNEIDPYAAQWLRNLIAAGHIAPGDVDERSIEDVHPDDLKPYTQCHFFAGIGVWSLALRRAGWSDDRPVWTGSCPCQPFSKAGPGLGFADERHLWPAWHHLIRERRPTDILGEQVADGGGLAWIDLVQADLEAEGYAFGAFDLCSAGFGAPHIRQRLWIVANANDTRLARRRGYPLQRGGKRAAGASGLVGSLAYPNGSERQARDILSSGSSQGLEGRVDLVLNGGDIGQRGPVNGFWRNADWLSCRDGKWRPVEPGTFPLAHGATARAGRLRAYGNAINAEAATQFIAAYLEATA